MMTSLEREPDRADARRHQRDRFLFPALVLLILGPSLLYVWSAARTAREIARRGVLQENLATAQLGARLIDAQCATALAVLVSLAERPSLIAAMGRRAPGSPAERGAGARDDQTAIERHLHDAVELVPDISLVAAYSPQGRLLARFPASPLAASAAGEEWFQECRRQGEPYVSSTAGPNAGSGAAVIRLAVPVGAKRHPVGYLMAPFRLEVIQTWVRPLQIGQGAMFYIVSRSGRMLASTGRTAHFLSSLLSDPPVRRGLAGREGRMEVISPLFHEPVLVGYAPARRPRWAVIAAQPVSAALGPANGLLQQLSLLVLPILLLVLGAGGAIERLYRRQARLAQENTALCRDLALKNEGLRAADQAKSDFLANVSHDLRTPLASIKASISGLLEPDIEWDHATLRGFLTLVNEEIDRLHAQVRNLLDMTRIEAQALVPTKGPCDLADIVDSALERVEPLTRGRRIEIELSSEPLLIEADYAQMETVVMNLLENALKYSSPGEPLRLRGEVGGAPGEPEGEHVIFSLRDAGPGVSPGEEERIFEKFYRGEATRRARGSGLGLTICRAIVQAHGGRIGVRAVPEGGAEFWFSLPRLQPPAAASEGRAA